jgi:uncharacterized protein YhaN
MTALTLEDVVKYVTMIRINFENAYKAQSDEEREMLYMSWFAILKDYPKEVCDKAVINAIKNAEFAPRIGSIVKEIERMREAYEKSETELWAELSNVLREVNACRSRFNATFIEENGRSQGDNARIRLKEIFDELSPELKEYCRNADGLLEIAKIETADLQFEKARFLKMIPTLKERAKTRQETSDKLAGLIQGLSGQFAIDNENTKLLKG